MAKNPIIIALAGLAATFAIWIAANHDLRVGLLYTVMLVVGVLFYLALPLEGIDLYLTRFDVFLGFGMLLTLVMLSAFGSNLVISVPHVQSLGGVGDGLVVTALAPFVEEFFFKIVLFGLLAFLGLNFILDGSVVSLSFMLFHFTAYGGNFVNSAALLGALVFSLMTTAVVFWRRNLLPSLITHAGFNAFILTTLTVFR